MAASPNLDGRWSSTTPRALVDALHGSSARWWISGGVALDLFAGRTIRERPNLDVSTIPPHLPRLIAALPAHWSAWAVHEGALRPWTDVSTDADVQAVLIRDEHEATWVVRINVEDGTDAAWLYRRDPRLQLPWERAVREIDGIPVGAPEVQLVWKALRPRPQDDEDKDAVLPLLDADARAWWERAILSIHPHSSWSIPVRTPRFPAKSSWNRSSR
ncbi:nucleotidyltransferase domain-containing protein [Microbacterium sp. RU33B]|uniref:nucleotidyltransferase domain-containing protein n=1 Tax=Microbacterium sp. RU33B TaxID=1907390 RepID=UPI000959BA77|nr:hypothetical protein [Microbacterium sp. RU33B]SIT67225.1 hypothetical protein SAMN05880545_0121 [Microbacterium sp. RU33B]